MSAGEAAGTSASIYQGQSQRGNEAINKQSNLKIPHESTICNLDGSIHEYCQSMHTETQSGRKLHKDLDATF